MKKQKIYKEVKLYEWIFKGFNLRKINLKNHPEYINVTYDDKGFLHSYDNKPAFNYYFTKSNTIYISEWYKNGKKHRLDGPALVYHSNLQNSYYLEGRRYEYEKWLIKREEFIIEENRNQMLGEL